MGSDVSGRGQDPCDVNMQHLLGSKGQNLADMSRIGLCVPPGFTVTTAVCAEFHKSGAEPLLVWRPPAHHALNCTYLNYFREFGRQGKYEFCRS